ncbi:MAG: hypothetical protein HC892_00325 [Saprospiraceae bacterium]|nr:hypothetical protein [Saprospiraceae bacterium]
MIKSSHDYIAPISIVIATAFTKAGALVASPHGDYVCSSPSATTNPNIRAYSATWKYIALYAFADRRSSAITIRIPAMPQMVPATHSRRTNKNLFHMKYSFCGLEWAYWRYCLKPLKGLPISGRVNQQTPAARYNVEAIAYTACPRPLPEIACGNADAYQSSFPVKIPTQS